MMIEIEVKVSGPGGCINFEMEVIRRAFESNGYQIEVKDDYPVICELVDEHINQPQVLNKPRQIKILLVAKHYPWGG